MIPGNKTWLTPPLSQGTYCSPLNVFGKHHVLGLGGSGRLLAGGPGHPLFGCLTLRLRVTATVTLNSEIQVSKKIHVLKRYTVEQPCQTKCFWCDFHLTITNTIYRRNSSDFGDCYYQLFSLKSPKPKSLSCGFP